MTLGQKIAALIIASRMTKVEVAKKIGLANSGVITHWTKDRHKPDRDNIDKLAKLFDKPVEYFASDSSAGFEHVARHGGPGIAPPGAEIEAAYVPVLGTVPADRFAFSLDAIPEEQIPNPYGSKKVFALRVIGDCMVPTFRDGDYIYFSVTQPVADGKIVLARLDGEHTLKRYFKRANGIELRPDNPSYKGKIFTTNKLEIIAVAVGRYGKL